LSNVNRPIAEKPRENEIDYLGKWLTSRMIQPNLPKPAAGRPTLPVF